MDQSLRIRHIAEEQLAKLHSSGIRGGMPEHSPAVPFLPIGHGPVRRSPNVAATFLGQTDDLTPGGASFPGGG
jgi:hypothetical protein